MNHEGHNGMKHNPSNHKHCSDHETQSIQSQTLFRSCHSSLIFLSGRGQWQLMLCRSDFTICYWKQFLTAVLCMCATTLPSRLGTVDDHHVIIWTNQSLPDILWLSPPVSAKLIHVDRSDWKMLMTPDLNIEICDTKMEPIAAQLARQSFPLRICGLIQCSWLTSLYKWKKTLTNFFV